jgi:hypothetical protein
MSKFTVTSVSTSGAPDIEFHFEGDTCRADLEGAKLYCEGGRDDGGIDMRLQNASGEILADLVVNKRAHRNDTENLVDVASALMWSHWRWRQAEFVDDANVGGQHE